MDSPEAERIRMLLDLLATVEDAGCEIIAESRRLRRMLRRVSAQKGHSAEERERVLAEVERRVVVLGGLAKARRDDLLLIWKAAREVEEAGEERGPGRRRSIAAGAASLWGWLWGGG